MDMIRTHYYGTQWSRADSNLPNLPTPPGSLVPAQPRIEDLPTLAINLRRPEPGWEVGLETTNVHLSGYTFLPDEATPMTSKPCPRREAEGACLHVGVFLPFCVSEQSARDAAKDDLAEREPAATEIGERRWIHPVSIAGENIYDLRQILDRREANWVHRELFYGKGKEEPVWRLLKYKDCNGVFLPTRPRTMFMFERVRHELVLLGEQAPPPVKTRPNNFRIMP
jgi:hypothetical protein